MRLPLLLLVGALLPTLLAAPPVGAQTPPDLLAGGTWTLNRPGEGDARLETVPADALRGKSALRITVRNVVAGQPWRVQIVQRVPGEVKAGQMLRLRFWGRSRTGSLVAPIFEKAGEPHTKSLDLPTRLGPAWKEFAYPFETPAYPAGGSAVNFQAGFAPGEIELAGIRLEDYGVAPAIPPASVNADFYGGQRRDDTWRAAAAARIRRYRMGDVVVRVVDAAGRPVSGADVTIAQTRHAFKWGTAVADGPLLAQTPDGEKYRATLLRLFNYVVTENALKWDFRGNNDFQTADRMLTWFAEHDLPARGHVLFWPGYRWLPADVRPLRGQAMREAVEKHVRDFAGRTRGRVVVWDVVNEAYSNREVLDEAGRDLLWKAFAWAREADPGIDLAYNDYNILNNRAGANDAQKAGVYAIVRELKANNAPVTVFGDQAHMTTPLTPGDRLVAILDESAKLGLPIEITEYDAAIKDDRAHAQYQHEFMTAIFSHPAVRSFVLWGFWEGAHWKGGEGGALFRRDWTPRPAARVYERLVFQDWWTNAAGTTDRQGAYRTRAFLGSHAVTVRKNGRTSAATAEVVRNENGETVVTVRL